MRSVEKRLANLSQIGGEALVARLLAHFEQHLSSRLGRSESFEATWSAPLAHQTAGLAGMLGFERLTSACRAVEHAPEPGGDLQSELGLAAREALDVTRDRLRYVRPVS